MTTILIIVFLVTVFGITGIIHSFLCLIPASFGTSSGLFLMAIIQWLLTILLIIWIDPSLKSSVHWIFLTAFLGLIIYGLIARKDFTPVGGNFLGAEQVAVFFWFVATLIFYLVD